MSFLKRSPLFSSLSEEEAEKLSRLAFERSLKRGQFLFREGEECGNFYLLLEGKVRMFLHSSLGKDLTLVIYLHSGVLGPTSVFRDRPPSGSMQATTAVRVLGFKKEDLIHFMLAHPQVMMEIIKVLAARVSELNRRLRDVAGERVDQRLLHVLVTLCNRFGTTLEITRHDLAEMVGATRETVIRALGSLKKQKIIASVRGRILILEAKKLKSLSEGPW